MSRPNSASSAFGVGNISMLSSMKVSKVHSMKKIIRSSSNPVFIVANTWCVCLYWDVCLYDG